MGTSIEVIDDRTNKNTENIGKIYKCLFGTNGSGGGIVGEIKEVKTNFGWIKWLLVIQIGGLIGHFVKDLFI